MDISAANGITSKSVELICPYGENGSEINESLYQIALANPSSYQLQEITSDLYCQWKFNTKKIRIDYGDGEYFEGSEIHILEPDKFDSSTGEYTGTYDLAVDRATPLWYKAVDETAAFDPADPAFGKKIDGMFAGKYQLRTYYGIRVVKRVGMSGVYYETLSNQTDGLVILFFIRKDRFYYLHSSSSPVTVTENTITKPFGVTITVLERFPIAS